MKNKNEASDVLILRVLLKKKVMQKTIVSKRKVKTTKQKKQKNSDNFKVVNGCGNIK